MDFNGLGVSRRRLCAGVSLVAVAFLVVDPVSAACTPNPPIANGMTVCTGTSGSLVVSSQSSTATVTAGSAIQSTGSGITTQNSGIVLRIDGTVAANSGAGILVQNGLPIYDPDPYAGPSSPGSNYSYPYFYPNGQASIVIGAAGAVSGNAGIELAQASYNSRGGVYATIDNSGSITGTSGIAILGAQNSTVSAQITNRQGGFIGGIFANVSSLDNAGTIDGQMSSAINMGGSYDPISGGSRGTVTNSGAIISSSTAATLRGTQNTLYVTNSGRIENSAGGRALEAAGSLYLTNASGGAIITGGAVAISGGSVDITNRGTITGSVVATGASRIDNSGGTINGDVLFGAQNDILIVGIGQDGALVTGVTGRIDGGAGSNRLQVAVSQDVTLKTAPILPDNFQIFSAAMSNGAKLTLDSGFQSSGAVAVTGSGKLDNEGRITTVGTAIGLADYLGGGDLVIANAGTIAATLSDGTQAAISVPTATRIENSGTIQATGGMAIATGSNTQAIVNSGTISSNAGLTIGFGSGQAKVENLVGGVISGGNVAIGYSNSDPYSYQLAMVVNAGRIDGAVDFTGRSVQNVFVQQQGGVVNGDIRLGGGDDIYVVQGSPGEQGLLTGLNGTLDGGDGFDRILARITDNATTSLGSASLSGIEQLAIDISQDKTVTLGGPITNISLAVTGKGTVKFTGDISGTKGALIDASLASISLPGEPYSYSYDTTTIVNTGTITARYDNRGSYYTASAVLLGSDVFTNDGTINLTSITDPNYNSRSSAIAGGSAVTNSGAILLDGGLGISGAQDIVNTGVIRQVAGGENAYGISGFRTLTNSGTISTGNTAVFSSNYTNGVLLNSGTIESATAPAIVQSGALLRVVNGAAGVIKGGAGGPAITSTGGATVENAGTIVGDVWLGYGSRYYSTGSAYIASGGTISGNLRFGAGDDLLLVEDGKTGISGTIDGGDGLDTYGRSYRSSGTVSLGQPLPTSFEAEAVEAITTDTVLTLTGTPLSSGVALYGSGTFVNTVAFASGDVNAPATVTLGGALRNDAQGALAFSNQASGSFRISGTARNFANSGTLTNSSYYATVSLNADASRDFVFSNSGSISGSQQSNYYYGSGAVVVYDGYGSPPLTAKFANSGSIAGGMSLSMQRSSVDFSNSGTITSSNRYAPAVQLTDQSGAVAAIVNILNTGTISTSSGTAINASAYSQLEEGSIERPSLSLVNRGSIVGAVTLDASALLTSSTSARLTGGTVSLDNGGTIQGNVTLGLGDDSFIQRANGSVIGTVDGGAGNNLLVFELGTGNMAPNFAQFTNFQSYAVTGTGLLTANLDLPFDTLGLTDGSFTVAQGQELQTRGAVTLRGGAGNETVVNNGIIHGAVEMGAGDDNFVNNGSVEGNIDLGAGNDRYASTYGANRATVDGGDGTDTLSLGFAGTTQVPVRPDLSSYRGFEILEMTSGVVGIDDSLAFQTLLINGGRLIGYAGSTITAPQIMVARGATFGSAGTVIGDIAVAGTLSPGASPGTMRVNGNVALGTGSTTLFELTPTINDQLLISGKLVIANGAALTLTGNRPLTPGSTLDLIIANGGIAGSFSTISQSSVFGFIRQTGDRVQLLGQFLNNGFAPQTATMVDYVNAALVTGQASSALLEKLPSLLTPSGETDGAKFSLLSAEAYASASQIGIERGVTLAKAARAGLATPHGERGWFSFGQALGDWHTLNGDTATGVSRAKMNSYGLISGIGYAAGPISVGSFVGYLNSQQDIASLGASTKVDGVFGGVMSRFAQGGFSAKLMAGYDRGSTDTKRILPSQGSAKGHYMLTSMIVDVSLDYRLPLGSGWFVTPQAGYSLVSARRGNVNETDGGPFALSVRGQTVEANFVDAAIAVEGGEGFARPWLSAGLRHQLSGVTPYAQAAFTGVSDDFRSLSVSRNRTLATVGGGLSFDLSKGVSAFATYQGEFGSESTGHNASAGLRIGF